MAHACAPRFWRTVVNAVFPGPHQTIARAPAVAPAHGLEEFGQ